MRKILIAVGLVLGGVAFAQSSSEIYASSLTNNNIKSTEVHPASLNEVVYYHANGNIRGTGTFEEGYMVGLWRTYDFNGILRMEGTFNKSKKDGLWNFYNENGQLAATILYDNNKVVERTEK